MKPRLRNAELGSSIAQIIWSRLTKDDLLTAAMWIDRYCHAKDTELELWLN
jgi:hypothetical protein